MKHIALLFAPVCILIAGSCASTSVDVGSGGSSGADGGGGGSQGCAIDSDCGDAHVCAFLESAACSAKGKCFPAPGIVCQAYSAGCACDGTVINVACTGLPEGYASKPLAHAGECSDAGCSGQNICLSTVHCATDADCSELGSKCDACTHLCGCGVPDGGACCPSSWTMYTCAYPDGGSGLACHDPAMGCASSTTCGVGCDAIVLGRCDGG